MTVVELMYYIGYAAKKKFAIARRQRLSAKVISIGNLTVGGTGKTPATIAVSEEAKRRGYKPIILTRGYMGKARGASLVSDGTSIMLDTEHAGDEPLVMARSLKNVPVVKSADRYQGGLLAFQHFGDSSDQLLFILDDGFQHWRLQRDVDVVLIDGQKGFGNKRLLPCGPLRSPLSELKDADIIVISRTRNDLLTNEIRKFNKDAPIFFATHEIAGVVQSNGTAVDPAVLKGWRVMAFCGIANPESFQKIISALGCEIAEIRQFRDHHRYREKDIRDLEARARKLGAEFLLTTEKDMVKILELPNLPINMLSIVISFNINQEFYDNLFQMVSSSP
ncbi:MAG TPA: tetraacyldisaccharide 4'-kinase [Dissulfurispiraceae bacterium]|nr:tetraacyldisaccharide 4'-kinase [Dissulfurispiraceae bacterium]